MGVRIMKYIDTIKFAKQYLKINHKSTLKVPFCLKISKTKTQWKSTHIECHIKQQSWTEHVTMAAEPSLKIPGKEGARRQIIIVVLTCTNTYIQADRIFLNWAVRHHVCLSAPYKGGVSWKVPSKHSFTSEVNTLLITQLQEIKELLPVRQKSSCLMAVAVIFSSLIKL